MNTVQFVQKSNNPMPYTLAFRDQKTHLQVLFDGNFRAGDVKHIWEEIQEYLSDHPSKRVLVEEKPGATAELLDTTEIYDAAKFFASANITSGIKVALLYAEGVSSETLEQARFGATVAHNRGFNMRVFENKDHALAWLLLK